MREHGCAEQPSVGHWWWSHTGYPVLGMGMPLSALFLHLLLVPARVSFCLGGNTLSSLAIKRPELTFCNPFSLSSPRPTPFPSHSSQTFILSMTLAALYPEYSRAVGQGAMEASRFPLCDISQVGAGLGAVGDLPSLPPHFQYSAMIIFWVLQDVGSSLFFKMDHLCNLKIIQWCKHSNGGIYGYLS